MASGIDREKPHCQDAEKRTRKSTEVPSRRKGPVTGHLSMPTRKSGGPANCITSTGTLGWTFPKVLSSQTNHGGPQGLTQERNLLGALNAKSPVGFRFPPDPEEAR